MIKYTELFYSLQGEGMFVGVPSIFLRTFGCNFRCKKFGLSRDQLVGNYNPEVEKILNSGLDKYKDYNSLPLVHTGCDTYASIYPEFKKFAKTQSVEAIVDEIQKLLPDGKFSRDKHLIITGGEPLLGWQKQYPALIQEIRARQMNLTDITFETNGTQKINEELMKYLHMICTEIKTTFSVSAKLPVSGEPWEEAIQPHVVHQYTSVPRSNTYLKFVVADEQDIQDAIRATEEYKEAGVNCPVYLMPVGGTGETYEKYERKVADFCRDNGFRFSPRIQVPLYKNAWGT